MYMMKNQLWFFCLFFVSNEYVSPICFFFPLFWFSWFLLIISYSYFHHIYKYLAIVSSNFFSHILSFLSFWDFNYVQIKCLVLSQVSDTVIFSLFCFDLDINYSTWIFKFTDYFSSAVSSMLLSLLNAFVSWFFFFLYFLVLISKFIIFCL